MLNRSISQVCEFDHRCSEKRVVSHRIDDYETLFDDQDLSLTGQVQLTSSATPSRIEIERSPPSMRVVCIL